MLETRVVSASKGLIAVGLPAVSDPGTLLCFLAHRPGRIAWSRRGCSRAPYRQPCGTENNGSPGGPPRACG